MNRRRAAWTNRLSTDERARNRAERLKQAAIEHDALEYSCAELSEKKYKVRLYKADAQAVKVRNKTTGNVALITRCTSGIPDRICAIPPTGRFVGFEFKTGGGQLRDNQAEIHEELTTYGAAVFVVRSVNEFIRFMELILGMERDKHRKLEAGRDQK